MDVMGEKKIEELEAQTGRDVMKPVSTQLASYISHTRLSQICVKLQSRLVLDRPEGLGGGTGEDASRRGRTAWLERKWEKERQAQLIAARQGWRIRRTGDFQL